MKRMLSLMLLCLGCAVVAPVGAQDYPAKPITLVVPYPPGGGVDMVGRLVGAELAKRLGQSVVIENRPGAGGTLGATYVSRAAPDGYTLLVGGTGPLSVAPALFKKLAYSPVKDLAPVSLLVVVPQVLVVSPSLGVNSVTELLAKARAKPGSLRMASGGNGTGQHLAGAMLMHMANVQFIHVPYKGTAAAVNDLLGGHVDLLFADPTIVQLVNTGQLKALGVTSRQRSPGLPSVQSIGETQVPGYGFDSFYGLTAPAGTPPAVLARLNEAVAAILADKSVSDRLKAEGMIPTHTTLAQTREYIAAHAKSSADLLAASAVSVD